MRQLVERVDPEVDEQRVGDGESFAAGDTLAVVRGSARAVLTAERIGLNFVQRMSGIATLTAAYVAAVAGTGARIADTRKTTPGLRRFERHAVRSGGGEHIDPAARCGVQHDLARLPGAEVGEIVVTNLDPHHPQIRLAVGDLTAILPGASACGRTNTRIKGSATWTKTDERGNPIKGAQWSLIPLDSNGRP